MTVNLPPPPLRSLEAPDPVSDHELIEASLTRPDAFAGLFERHADAVHGYLSRRVGDLADDLLSEIFLTAFRKRASYRPTGSDTRPWLFGIAANHVRRHHRAETARYRQLARLQVVPAAPDETDALLGRVLAHGLKPRLAAALATLDGRDRDVLLLVAWADLNQAEVATALGLPLGTVKSRLHRARRQVRTALDLPDDLTGDLR